MLVLWYFVFGIALPFKATSSPRDLTSSVRAKEEVRHSEAFKLVEQALLKSMGLKTRPRPRRSVRVPQYMKDLYNSNEDHPEWSSTNFRFNGKWTSVNTVRAFHHEEHKATRATNTDRCSVIKFDLSTFPKHEEIHSAELRLYRSESWRKANDTKAKINVFQVLLPSMPFMKQSTKIIGSRLVNLTQNGWESFDVLSSVEHWLQNPSTNHGIQAVIESTKGNVVNVFCEAKMREEKPLLVMFSRDSRKHFHVRRKRSNHAETRTNQELTKQNCRRIRLPVNFKEPSFNSFILAPDFYSAFNCAGKCPSNCIPEHFNRYNGTNHAAIVRLITGASIPKVCCLPTKLSPVSVLYFDEDSNVVLRKFNNMVVEECGCVGATTTAAPA